MIKNIFILVLIFLSSSSFSQIFQPLEYSKPQSIYDDRSSGEIQNSNQKRRETIESLNRKFEEANRECQSNVWESLKKFNRAGEVKNETYHNAYILSNSYCEVVRVYVSENKVTKILTLKYDPISFSYSNKIEDGQVMLLGENYLGAKETSHIIFHEVLYKE